MQRVLVCGAGGFIGSHLVRRLKAEGFWTRGVDLKPPQFWTSHAHEFIIGDLRDPNVAREAVSGMQDVDQLAADMGGAGYIFTGEHDAAVMHNSATINLNVLEFGHQAGVERFFYSSSACIYPERNQMDAGIAEKPLNIVNIKGPVGVRGRKSDNRLIRQQLGWAPSTSLSVGLVKTFHWIADQVAARPSAVALAYKPSVYQHVAGL